MKHYNYSLRNTGSHSTTRTSCMFIFALGVLTCMYIHFSRGSLEGMLSLYSMLFFLRNGKRHINLATNARRKNVGIKLSPLNVVSLRITKCVSILTVVLWFTCLVLNLSGDIHPNPGPSSTLSNSDSDTSACSLNISWECLVYII